MLLPVGRLSCSRPALLSLLSATAMLAGCKDEHPVAEAPTPVRVQRIEMETATEGRAYTGVARARYETDLGFRVAGKIAERLVNVGDRVDKDQPLARLDPTDYRLAVESSRAEVAAADEQRYEKLLTDLWVSPAAYEQKKAAADEAHGRVERAERALDVARNQLAYTELRANDAGIVTALPVGSGQAVAVGQLAVRSAQLAAREVVVAVPESRLDDARASAAVIDLRAAGQFGGSWRVT